MMVSSVYSEQLDLISLMAELRMELSNSSENRLRKESSAKVIRSIELTPVIFLDVFESTVRKNLMNRKLFSFPTDPGIPPSTCFAAGSFLAKTRCIS